MLDASLSTLQLQMILTRQMDMLADNLANVGTAGFKNEMLAVSARRMRLPGGTELIDQLMHQIAIANTKLIYRDFKSIFHGDEFADLAEKTAAVQRPLWGSTSTKSPNLRDTLYVEELVGPETVNTIPSATFKALIDHGRIRGNTLEEDVGTAEAKIEQLRSLGIEIEDVCMELQKAGVKSFADSFDQLIDAVKKTLA